MSAVKGKELANFTVKTLQAMKHDHNFNLFFETVKKSASTYNRKRRAPIISSSNILKAIQVLLLGKLTIQKPPSIISN